MVPPCVLAVMGLTGAGKSTFVKLVTGDNRIIVGHSQESETKHISSHEVYIHGQRFTIVDTPGFDDLYVKDSDVLKMLVDWLASTYRSGQKLNGILYLHRITDARMRGSSLRNFNMFKQLIGEDFYKNVTLGTSCWSLETVSVALDRETELKTGNVFWKALISKGARLERIPDDVSEAQNLVYQIANHDALALQTQRDVVDLGKSFKSLALTKMVDYELDEMRKHHEQELKTLREAQEKQKMFNERFEQLTLKYEVAKLEAEKWRIEEYRLRRKRCQRRKPYGNCDNSGCSKKLQRWDNQSQRWDAIFHCCFCGTQDLYWQCAACGNKCGNDEHPTMSKVDNPVGECVVM